MPVWLISLLPYLKRAAPYLGGLALLLSAYWWADSRGRSAQKAKDDKAISALTDQRESWQTAFYASDTNFKAAITAANDESANIMALKADGDTRARMAAANVAEYVKRETELTGQNKALLASAGRHYSASEPCTSSGTYMTSKDM